MDVYIVIVYLLVYGLLSYHTGLMVFEALYHEKKCEKVLDQVAWRYGSHY